jgi:hypothetical protein
MNVQLGAQLAAALQHEQRAAMACFASAETVRRVGQDVRSKTH